MKLIRLAFVALAAATVVFGQLPAGPASPEVLPDRRVTFRVAAPKATEVALICDWLTAPQKMEKGADGTWSLTVGPLAPSNYIYSFNLDGVIVPDPINPRIKLRARTSASIVEVPAAAPALDEVRDVPHGAVEINWHKSATLGGETRSVWVYTPPGYAADTARHFPVLYLLHGNNDRPPGWIDVANLNAIMDNLLAEKKAAPMLIVMPFGHALPFGQRGSGARTNTTVFESYLLDDVVPMIEAKYRVAPGREQRAVGGFSMGAEQALYIFFHHLDRFGSIAAMAPSGYRPLETEHAALLADFAGTNAKIGLLWIGCGRQDAAHINGAQQVADVLAAHHIEHTWRPVEGVHNFAFVRGQLLEILPRLFQKP